MVIVNWLKISMKMFHERLVQLRPKNRALKVSRVQLLHLIGIVEGNEDGHYYWAWWYFLILHKFMLYRETEFQLGLLAGLGLTDTKSSHTSAFVRDENVFMISEAEWVIGLLRTHTNFRISVNNIKHSKMQMLRRFNVHKDKMEGTPTSKCVVGICIWSRLLHIALFLMLMKDNKITKLKELTLWSLIVILIKDGDETKPSLHG